MARVPETSVSGYPLLLALRSSYTTKLKLTSLRGKRRQNTRGERHVVNKWSLHCAVLHGQPGSTAAMTAYYQCTPDTILQCMAMSGVRFVSASLVPLAALGQSRRFGWLGVPKAFIASSLGSPNLFRRSPKTYLFKRITALERRSGV
jgi:hypothetical protein